jgi:hypothetical protein
MLVVRKILTSLTRKLSYLLFILLFYNNAVQRIETGGRGVRRNRKMNKVTQVEQLGQRIVRVMV